MWEKQKGIILLNGRKTAKYIKSSLKCVIKHTKKFYPCDSVQLKIRINNNTPMTFGIFVNRVFVPIISYKMKNVIAVTLNNSKLYFYYNNKLHNIHDISEYNNKLIQFAVCLHTGTNSVTITKQIFIFKRSNNTVSYAGSDITTVSGIRGPGQKIKYLTDQDIPFTPENEIILVNTNIPYITLPYLHSDKLLTIIKTYNDGSRIPLKVRTRHSYSINDKSSITIYYNNAITLCGINHLNKWFII